MIGAAEARNAAAPTIAKAAVGTLGNEVPEIPNTVARKAPRLRLDVSNPPAAAALRLAVIASTFRLVAQLNAEITVESKLQGVLCPPALTRCVGHPRLA